MGTGAVLLPGAGALVCSVEGVGRHALGDLEILRQLGMHSIPVNHAQVLQVRNSIGHKNIG
jgi:hypothetical protein